MGPLALTAALLPLAAGLMSPPLPRPLKPLPEQPSKLRGSVSAAVGQHGGLLQHVTSHSLGLFQKPNVEVLAALPRSTANGPFVDVSYYKTGCIVGLEFHLLTFGYDTNWFYSVVDRVDFEQEPGSDRWSAGHYWDGPVELPPPLRAPPSYHVEFPTATWQRPRNARTVFWVRDPVKQILSAYRYETGPSLADTPDRWVTMKAKCGWCDLPSHHAVFETCGFNCSVQGLLNALPPESGVLVEATLQSSVLQNMVANIERWANDPDVLFLSSEHLSADFNGTMGCLIDFAGLQSRVDLPRLQLLDLSQFPSTHATAGLYNNTDLERTLEQQPHVAEPLGAVRNVLRAVYERQRRVYSCPVPEL